MNIRIISIGNKMPDWADKAFKDYQTRFANKFKVDLIEIPMIKRQKNSNLDVLKQKEATEILSKINSDDFTIALDEKGKQLRTSEFAKKIDRLQTETKVLNLIIGGPDGLDKSVLESSNLILSLSKFTLPHPLVRVVVGEQLYRVYSILTNHPYHRE